MRENNRIWLKNSINIYISSEVSRKFNSIQPIAVFSTHSSQKMSDCLPSGFPYMLPTASE